jgi:hypothetical protein
MAEAVEARASRWAIRARRRGFAGVFMMVMVFSPG